VRHRDIKLKEREEKKEDHIQRLMCEGICDRCREKVQWRFKFDKYKPLTKPGNCQNCKEKRIAKAYRSYCDSCAAAKKACAACCGDLLKMNSERRAEIEAVEAKKAAASLEKAEAEGGEEGEESGAESDFDGDEMENGADSDEAATEMGEGVSAFGRTRQTMKTDASYLETVFAQPTSVIVTDRDMRKIEDFGASKYSKARVVGSEEDKNLSKDLHLHTQTQKR